VIKLGILIYINIFCVAKRLAMEAKLMNNNIKSSIGVVILVLVPLTSVQANWNNNGCSDWPEWTPMYWMEKMMGVDDGCNTQQYPYQGNTIPYAALSSGINGNALLSQYPASLFRQQPVRKVNNQNNAGYGYLMNRRMYGQHPQYQRYPRWANGMGMNQFQGMNSGYPMMRQGFNPMTSGSFGSPMSSMGMSPMGMGSPMSPMAMGSPMSPMGFGSPMGMGSPMSYGGGRGFSPFSGSGTKMPFF